MKTNEGTLVMKQVQNLQKVLNRLDTIKIPEDRKEFQQFFDETYGDIEEGMRKLTYIVEEFDFGQVLFDLEK